MRWKSKTRTVRRQPGTKPIDDAEQREEWKASLAIIPDFDLSTIDSDDKLEALRRSTDLVLKAPGE